MWFRKKTPKRSPKYCSHCGTALMTKIIPLVFDSITESEYLVCPKFFSASGIEYRSHTRIHVKDWPKQDQYDPYTGEPLGI
jgi:hypothetical protein